MQRIQPERRREREKLSGIVAGVCGDVSQESGKLSPDLVEDFQIAFGHGFARALECVDRRVNDCYGTPQRRVQLEEPFSQQHPVERLKRCKQPGTMSETPLESVE